MSLVMGMMAAPASAAPGWGSWFGGFFGGGNQRPPVTAPPTTAPPTTAPTAPPVTNQVRSVDFAPSGVAPVAGYVADNGLPYSSARGFGWESIAGAPLNLSNEARVRDTPGVDRRLETLVHMESGRTAEGRWQLDIPNGTYSVTVGAGDSRFSDSRHVIRAEGKVLIDFVASASKKNETKTANVTVTDNKLTLDQIGGDNTKIGFVDVKNASGGITPPTTTPADTVNSFDFGPATSAPVAGYLTDTGSAYSEARKSGWETLSGAPLNLSAETRDRKTAGDDRLDTLVHMESGRTPEGRWQLDIANGTYSVTVGAGDPLYADSRHIVRAEGKVLIDFVASASKKTAVATANVTVTDGKLTLDQIGGDNTKIGFVEVKTGGGTTPPVTEPEAPITDEDEQEQPVAPAPDPDLLTDAEVKAILQMSGTIRSGRQFFETDERLRQWATKIAPTPGYYNIAMHGPTPENVRIGGTRYTAKQWAQVIKADPNWKGQNLKFISCNIGSDPNGFAQQLANELGVKVVASNTLTWVNSSGQYWATDAKKDARGNDVPVRPYNGKFIVFSPKSR